eukprot:15587891-Heterocapsa_arctica.AAC.1
MADPFMDECSQIVVSVDSLVSAGVVAEESQALPMEVEAELHHNETVLAMVINPLARTYGDSAYSDAT